MNADWSGPCDPLGDLLALRASMRPQVGLPPDPLGGIAISRSYHELIARVADERGISMLDAYALCEGLRAAREEPED